MLTVAVVDALSKTATKVVRVVTCALSTGVASGAHIKAVTRLRRPTRCAKLMEEGHVANSHNVRKALKVADSAGLMEVANVVL